MNLEKLENFIKEVELILPRNEYCKKPISLELLIKDQERGCTIDFRIKSTLPQMIKLYKAWHEAKAELELAQING